MKTTSQQRFSFNSWDRNILTLPTHTSFGRGKLASLGQDGPQEGLNMENRVASQLFFYALILPSTLRLDSVYGIKKPEPNDSGFPCREEYRIIEPNLCRFGTN